MSLKRILLLASLGLLLATSPSMAHKVSIFAYVEGGRIYTESYFPDGRPVAGGQVQIAGAKDKVLVEGTTDAEGRYECPIPEVSDLRISIEASMGHRNSYLLKRAEVEAGR